MSPMYFRPGRAAVKSRWNRSGTHEAAGSGTVVRTRLRRRMPGMSPLPTSGGATPTAGPQTRSSLRYWA